MYIVGLFLLFLTCIVTGQEPKYCLADDKNPYLYFSIKTSYHFTHGKFNPYKDCLPTQLYVVARHGTQYPRYEIFSGIKKLSELRDQIVTNHENNLGDLCKKDFENIKNWRITDNFNLASKIILSPQGKTDMRKLAKRLKAAFPTLFTTSFTSNMQNYEFSSDNTSKAINSMLAFAEGLIGTKTKVKPKKLKDKNMLQTFKNCPAFEIEKKSVEYLDEYTKFTNGQQIQDVLINVSRRLGFEKNLTLDDISRIYEACKYEKALNINAISAWCAAFSKDELKVLAYQGDLYSYYQLGPGRSINTKLGCPLMKDLFQHFRKLEETDISQEPKAIFYFVHLWAFNNLLDALGLKNDKQPLLASNYEESKGRLWDTSLINQFAANLVAAFYKCDGTSSKVVFHLSERLVELENCNKGVCDWKNIRDTLGRKAEECNMDFCHTGSGVMKKIFKKSSKSSSNSISNFNIIILLLYVLVGFNSGV